jgi:aminopeptidase N
MLEPYSAHKWFPCFDQPDLKAPYELLVLASKGWTVVSTAAGGEVDLSKVA